MSRPHSSFALICLFALLACGQSRASEDVVEQLKTNTVLDGAEQEASQLISQGMSLQARVVYQKTLAANPHWIEGWWNLGTLDYDLTDFKGAHSAFRNYLTLQPRNGSAWAFTALSEFELDERAESLADFARAYRLGVRSDGNLDQVASGHYLLLLNTVGNFARAFELVQKLSKFGCSSQLLLTGAGITALQLKLLPKEIPVDKRDLIAATGQVVCNAAANHSDVARSEFSELLRRFPTEPQLHYLYACFLVDEQPDEALVQLQDELTISKNHVPSMVLMSLEYLKQGQNGEALRIAESAVTIAPQNAQAQFALGKAEIQLHRDRDGLHHLEVASALSPKDRQILWALAMEYSQLKQPEAAKRVRARLATLDAEGVQK